MIDNVLVVGGQVLSLFMMMAVGLIMAKMKFVTERSE